MNSLPKVTGKFKIDLTWYFPQCLQPIVVLSFLLLPFDLHMCASAAHSSTHTILFICFNLVCSIYPPILSCMLILTSLLVCTRLRKVLEGTYSLSLYCLKHLSGTRVRVLDSLMTQLLLYEPSQQIPHQSSVLSKVTEQMMAHH